MLNVSHPTGSREATHLLISAAQNLLHPLSMRIVEQIPSGWEAGTIAWHPWCPCSEPWLKLISLEISGAASDVDLVFTEGFVIRMEVATDRVTFLLLNVQGRSGSQCQ